jgi:hypothetical protein
MKTRYQSQVLRLQTDNDFSKRLPIHLCGELLRLLPKPMSYSVRLAVEGPVLQPGERLAGWL